MLSRGIGNTSAAPKHLSCQLAPARILEGYAASVRSRGRSATTTVVAGGRTGRLIALRSARNQARRNADVPRRKGVAIQLLEQARRGCLAQTDRVLRDHRDGWLEKVGQREVVEADQRHAVA